MPRTDVSTVFWMLALLVGVALVGMLLVVAMLGAWRGYNRRQHLLDEGQRLRQSQHQRAEYVDTWSESGHRYADPDSDAGPASPKHEPNPDRPGEPGEPDDQGDDPNEPDEPPRR